MRTILNVRRIEAEQALNGGDSLPVRLSSVLKACPTVKLGQSVMISVRRL